MSRQAREALVASPNTLFQRTSQRADLLDESLTQTNLIALLTYLCVEKGHPVEFTAIRSDHHDDSALNPAPGHSGTHAGGWAADCWPLASPSAGNYLDANSARFQGFLRDVASAPHLHQIGLAGSARTYANRVAAGRSVFADDGGDHIHIGAQ